MRLLITGASGLLGLNLALEALQEHTVCGVDRQNLVNTPFELLGDDLLHEGAIERVLDAARPDWLVHCAALASLEGCESDPELAQRLNANLPGVLAGACRRRGIKMVHISTDAVFDGNKDGWYSEEDAPNPVGVYSVTKRQAEENVLSANPEAIVARVNFYGWSLSGTRSLAEFFFNNLSAGKTCRGFTDVHFCPFFAGDLADALLAMLAKDLSGIYHVVGPESMSKYDFGRRLAQRFVLDDSLIQPASVDGSGLTARRSHNLQLSIHKLSTALGSALPGFSTGMERFFTQYQQGYPQVIHRYLKSAVPGAG